MTDETPNYEAQFERRNERLQETIDVLSQYSAEEIDKRGTKAKICREHGLDSARITYVLNEWNDLVKWRRAARANPMSPDAVKAGYDDDVLREMAAADGGQQLIDVGLTLDEAFRAIKLLPSDMGVKIYAQILRKSGDLDPSELSRLAD